MTRQQWKVFYRQLRIIRHECRAAWEDMLVFGNGFIETGPNVPNLIRRVHPQDVTIELGA